MGYIGREPTNSGEFLLIDNISGDFDGSETSFTLKVGTSKITPAAANTVIALDGVLQEPSSSYSISGSTITFTAAPESTVTFYGVLAGQSQYITNYSITDDHISLTANISGSKINTNFGTQGFQLTSITASANISGSATSTGSFGRLELSSSLSASATSTCSFGAVYVGGMTNSNLVDVSSSVSTRVTTAEASGALFDGTGNVTFGNVTATGTVTAEEFHTEFVSASIHYVSGSTKFGDTSDDIHSFTGSIHLVNSGSVSGSVFSTGSFGRVDAAGDLRVDTAYFSNSTGIYTDKIKRYSDSDTTTKIILNDEILKLHAGHSTVPVLHLTGGTNGIISGSSTSTGSFGHLITDKDAHIGEDLLADGDVVAYNSSDVRLKDNIQVIKGSLDKIDGIRGVEFDWNDKSPGWAQERGHDVGVIAQEVQKVVPEIVVERKSGYLGVDYKRLVPLLIESVKELRQEVNDLKKKVN